MADTHPNHNFTIDFGQRVNEIGTNIKVGAPQHPSIGAISSEIIADMIHIKAIWDTGNTASTITKKIVTQLGLKPFSFTEVIGVNTRETRPVYKVSLLLPNNVCFYSINATECKTLVGGYDFLVGMNIINHGDFAVSHAGSRTIFSFRMPPGAPIKFGKTVLAGPNSPKAERNDPCSCGSGRKFKYCCGKQF